MSDGVIGGSINVSRYFQMRLLAGGDGTGKTITDFDLTFTRNGETPSLKQDATDLGAANAAHSDNGGYEVDPTDAKGLHRFDFPDAAFAKGVRDVELSIAHTDCFTETARIPIDNGSYDGPRGRGVYYDSAAGNTDTENGIDGTDLNPVSTIAATKTLADNLGVKRIYVINGSNATLAATMNHYEVITIGEMTVSILTLGSQNVDGSHFFSGILTGAQGGTGRIQATGSVLSAITGMEITAEWCVLANGADLVLRNDCAFLNCKSAIAGAGTPVVDVNGVADVNIYFRDYSGGVRIKNAVATTVISYDCPAGQLIIDASCTGLTIIPRGNLSLTDNGTSTNVNRDAVINLTNLGLTSLRAETRDANILDQFKRVIAVVESQRGFHTHQPIGDIYFVSPTNGDTHANGNRGGITDPYKTIQDCHDNAVTDSNHDLIILLADAAAGPTTHTETLTLSKRYLFIRGPGRDFIVTRSGAGNTITITADGIELSGCQVETAATGSGNGIQVTDADFHRIHHVWINDTQGDGINVLRGENLQIHDNFFTNTGQGGSGQGVHIVGTAGSSNNNSIHDNDFRDCAGHGIHIEDGTTLNTRIERNRIEGSTGWGINIGASSTDAFVADNRLGNNASGNINDGGTTTVEINNEQWGTAAALAIVDAVVDAIPTTAMRGTDGALTDKAGFALTSGERDSIAAALLDLTDGIESGMTLREAQRLISAALFGVLAGAATSTVTIKQAGGATTRITATVDADGNRSVVVLDSA